MVFEKIVRCPVCNTLNRSISHYCKECGSKVIQRSFKDEELAKILNKEVFEDRKATDEEVLRVKKILNDWINSIPYHPYRELFNKVEISSIILKPFYEVEFEILIESRSLNEKELPYWGEDYPQGKIDISNYSVWNERGIRIPKEFKKEGFSYDIPGTYEVLGCRICSMSGKVLCINCQGRGSVECYKCNGQGSIRCDKCSGQGRIKCYSCSNGRVNCFYCNGKGVDYNGDRCSHCGGKGDGICTNCNGVGSILCERCSGKGFIICESCNGRGFVICNRCGGKGVVICSQCSGAGRMIKNKYIEVNYVRRYISKDNSFEFEQDIFEDSSKIYFKKFDEINKKIFCELIFDEFDLLTIPIPHKAFLEAYNKAVSDYKNLISSLKLFNESGSRFILGKILFSKIDIYIVDYIYLNKSYKLYLSTVDDDISIYSSEDPISNFSNEVLHRIKESISKNNFEKAYEDLKLLQNLTNDISMFIDVGPKIVEHMSLDLKSAKNKILNDITNKWLLIILLAFLEIHSRKYIKNKNYNDYFTFLEDIKTKLEQKNEKYIFISSLLISGFFDNIGSLINEFWKSEKYRMFLNFIIRACEITGYFPLTDDKTTLDIKNYKKIIEKQSTQFWWYFILSNTLVFLYSTFGALIFTLKDSRMILSKMNIYVYLSFAFLNLLSFFIYFKIPLNNNSFILSLVILYSFILISILSGLIDWISLGLIWFFVNVVKFNYIHLILFIIFVFISVVYISRKIFKKRLENLILKLEKILEKSIILPYNSEVFYKHFLTIFLYNKDKNIHEKCLEVYKTLVEKTIFGYLNLNKNKFCQIFSEAEYNVINEAKYIVIKVSDEKFLTLSMNGDSVNIRRIEANEKYINFEDIINIGKFIKDLSCDKNFKKYLEVFNKEKKDD